MGRPRNKTPSVDGTPVPSTRKTPKKTSVAVATAIAADSNGSTGAKRARKPRVKKADIEERGGEVKQEEEDEEEKANGSEKPVAEALAATRKRPGRPATRKSNDLAKYVAGEETEEAEEVDGSENADDSEEHQHGARQSSGRISSTVALERLAGALAHLPGVFAPGVDTGLALRSITDAVLATIPLVLATSGLISQIPLLWPSQQQHWATYQDVQVLPGIWSWTVQLLFRACKLSLAWDAPKSLFAVDTLCLAPLVYLLVSFYEVPLLPALLSVTPDCLTDVASLYGAQWKIRREKGSGGVTIEIEDEDGVKVEVEDVIVAAASGNSSQGADAGTDTDTGIGTDRSSTFYSVAFAGVLYFFVLTQAAFVLPGIFVVHYPGIATVEPARHVVWPLRLSLPSVPLAQTLSSLSGLASLPAGLALRKAYQFAASPSVVAGMLASVLGSAAYAYIFAPQMTPAFYPSQEYRRNVTARTLTLTVLVGLSVFAQVILGIRGVDKVGAASYASVWAVPPVLVGAGLGLVGV